MTETNIKLPAKYYEEGNKIYHEKLGAVTNGTIRITEFQRRISEKGSNLVVRATFILPDSDQETTVEIPMNVAKSTKVMKYLPEEFVIYNLSDSAKKKLITDCFCCTLGNMMPTQTFELFPGYNKVEEQYVYVLGDHLIDPLNLTKHTYINSKLHLMPDSNQPSNYIKWLRSFWKLDANTMPTLFLSVIASLMHPYLQEVGIDTGFVAYVNGETGNGKSTVVKLLTEIFEENNYWTVSSDLRDVRKKMTQRKDFVFLFDDLNKTETTRVRLSKESKVSEIIQQAANYDTVESNGEGSSFQGILIITAEYTLKNISTRNRCVLINLSSCLDMEILGTLKERKSDYIFFLKKFISWLCKNKNTLMDKIQKLDSIGLTKKTYKPQDYAGIARIERTEHILNISMEFFLEFLHLPKEQESQLRQLFKKSIMECIDDTRDTVRKLDAEHGRDYVDVIISEFTTTESVAKDYKSYKKKRKETNDIIFFCDEDCFCITGDDLVNLFQNREGFEKAVSKKAISDQLLYHGLLKIQGGERSFPYSKDKNKDKDKDKNKDKDKERYYHIYVNRIIEMMNPNQYGLASICGAIKELRPSYLQNDDDYDSYDYNNNYYNE